MSIEMDLSIFHQEWWLSTASDNSFDAIKIKDSHNKVIAYFPYFMKKRAGLSIIRMPKYTRTLGPALFLPPSKPFRREQSIRNIVQEIIAQLPPYDGVEMFLDPDTETTFGFTLSGWTIKYDFTFRIPANKPSSQVWQECDHKTRNLIRAASKKLEVRYEDDVNIFITLSSSEQEHNRHNFPLLERLFNEASRRNQARVISAYTDDGKVIASCLVIWDHKNLYYWHSARNKNISIPGSNMLLIWKAYELAQELGITFDFDGYSTPASARMSASFGQKPLARPEISQGNTLYHIERFGKRHLEQYRSWKQKHFS